jgi:hypothetical protein
MWADFALAPAVAVNLLGVVMPGESRPSRCCFDARQVSNIFPQIQY